MRKKSKKIKPFQITAEACRLLRSWEQPGKRTIINMDMSPNADLVQALLDHDYVVLPAYPGSCVAYYVQVTDKFIKAEKLLTSP